MPMSDKEQKEMFKKLWKEYGNYLLFTLFIFAVANIGLRYWQRNNNSNKEHAAVVYMQLISAVDKKNDEEIKLFSGSLIKNYPKSQYASLAGLINAKEEVDKGNLQAANDNLSFVIKNSPNKGIKQIARIRSARILIEMGKAQEALDLLKLVADDAYKAETGEATGDALMALGRSDEAKKEYQKVDELNKSKKTQSPLLKMKLRQF